MTVAPLPSDPLWPRAGHWLRPASESAGACDIGVLGVPAWRNSITPTGAHATPSAVREALLRYSTYSTAHGVDLADARALDFGDVEEPDGDEGEARVRAAIEDASGRSGLLLVVGGDNSATYSAMTGMWAGDALREVGLVTVDAHHDLRDGITNGSPVRRLLEAGLPGSNIVQMGISDFANSAVYAERSREAGITVIPRDEFEARPLAQLVAYALERAGHRGRPVYVDIDVDAADRSVVPGCPSSAPGGFSAQQMRQLAFAFGRDERVRAIDLTEVDATIDTHDQRTIRLTALLLLEAATGYLCRRAGAPAW